MNNIFLILLCISCSSEIIKPKDECMPANADYIQTLSVTSGFCPDIPPTLIHLSEIGAYPINENDVCENDNQNYCHVSLLSCKYTGDTCMIYYKSDITFVDNGDSAAGFLSLAMICNGSFTCAGTYDIKLDKIK
jgi:hypothetical protein